MARSSGKIIEPADAETVARAIRAQRAAQVEEFLARVEPTLRTLAARVDTGAPLTDNDRRAILHHAQRAAALLAGRSE